MRFDKVSVIIPFVNEWPQIAFTIRAVHENLENIEHEIIVVDNYCQQVHDQGRKPDRGHDRYFRDREDVGYYGFTPEEVVGLRLEQGHVKAQASNKDWLKYVRYEDKLSHWNAKNAGVAESTGDLLLFLDSHVVPSAELLPAMCWVFRDLASIVDYDFTLHPPLAYHILDSRKLIYKMVYEPEKGNVHYRFSTMPKDVRDIFEVPCMSTCGMMMTRSLFTKIGGWPTGLGIYGGGENYINYLLGVIGAKKLIYPHGCLYHHGEKRGYEWNWEDYQRNRLIATSIFGGVEMADTYQKGIGGNSVTKRLFQQALMMRELHGRKMSLGDGPFQTVDEYCKEWGNALAIDLKSGRRHE